MLPFCAKKQCKCILYEQRRWIARKYLPKNAQNPEEVSQMPIYQYATEKSKLKTSVWVWGYAQFGALGMRNYVKPVDGKPKICKQQRPANLYFSRKNQVIDVACGYGFTLIAVKSDERGNDQVFGTGLNTDSQIGYHAPHRGHPLEFLIEPAPISLPLKSPNSTKVKQVACGRAHSLVLTDKEGVFSLGNNAYGQCGRPVIENEDYKHNPRVEQIHIEKNIEQVICGQDNSIFISENGEVYCAGWGADGQLGIGHFKNEWQPSKVIGDIQGERIVQISCAADCVLALSDKGQVFGWGNSEYGQLARATTSQQLCLATHIPLKDCGKVIQVAAAGTMCAVLNDEGQVFVWGYGLLGKGPELQHSSEPSLIPATLFGRNEFSPNLKVAKIFCGLNQFAAVTSMYWKLAFFEIFFSKFKSKDENLTGEGDLFTWGRTDHPTYQGRDNPSCFFPT